MLALCLALSGCASWDPVAGSPIRFIEEQRPSRIRVLLVDESRFEMFEPRIQRDSIFGETIGRGIPIADLVRLEKRGASGVAILGTAVAIPLIAMMIAGARCEC